MTEDHAHPSSAIARRQFAVGNSTIDLTHVGMTPTSFGGKVVWTGNDLPLATSGPIMVIGLAAVVGGASIQEHFSSVTSETPLDTIVDLSMELVGRFVIFADLNSGFNIVPDPMASKRVFLSLEDQMASSSELLLQRVGATARPRTAEEQDLLDFPALVKREFAMFGLYSPVTGYRRLLTHRTVNLDTGEIDLCDPATKRRKSTVTETAAYLRKVARATSTLGPIELGLTAGYDSRLLLAAFAAEGIDMETMTFVDGGEEKEYDAAIASDLAQATGYRHNVIVEPEPDEQIKHLLAETQALVRPLPKVYKHLTWFSRQEALPISVSGIGGEVIRWKYNFVPKGLGYDLTKRMVMGRTVCPQDLIAYDEWFHDRFDRASGSTWMPVTAIHHWEQRVPIWAAMFFSEKDLFVDEVSGFNCGGGFQRVLGIDGQEHDSDSVFMALTEELCPKLCAISPPSETLKTKLKHLTPLPRLATTLQPGWGT